MNVCDIRFSQYHPIRKCRGTNGGWLGEKWCWYYHVFILLGLQLLPTFSLPTFCVVTHKTSPVNHIPQNIPHTHFIIIGGCWVHGLSSRNPSKLFNRIKRNNVKMKLIVFLIFVNDEIFSASWYFLLFAVFNLYFYAHAAIFCSCCFKFWRVDQSFLASAIEIFSKILLNLLPTCKICAYNIISKMRGLIPQST